MNFTLKPEQQRFIEAELSTGRYTNPDEIIAEALRLLEKRNQYDLWIEEVRNKVDIGIEQLDRGEGIDGESVITQLKVKLQQRREA
jgi:antitoxin ParD1/3/4